MILTAEQREKVEQNIRLVRKVINDKVHGPYQLGIYTYDDIFQIGCIGLCKAAATDKGGTFSTYAYRLIWNEICDALIYSTRRQATELSSDSPGCRRSDCIDCRCCSAAGCAGCAQSSKAESISVCDKRNRCNDSDGRGALQQGNRK